MTAAFERPVRVHENGACDLRRDGAATRREPCGARAVGTLHGACLRFGSRPASTGQPRVQPMTLHAPLASSDAAFEGNTRRKA
ncbi:hypothetical protein DF051_35260 [Burkholderia contaminans]|uniref:Uncharacterized protein n=1 Tax=Burkholderia contaminans TaxID=488447 RepID=A0A3N8P2B3_9BURK|nr:hypothetical protein DF051_35260 [Burkholderia contaminans]